MADANALSVLLDNLKRDFDLVVLQSNPNDWGFPRDVDVFEAYQERFNNFLTTIHDAPDSVYTFFEIELVKWIDEALLAMRPFGNENQSYFALLWLFAHGKFDIRWWWPLPDQIDFMVRDSNEIPPNRYQRLVEEVFYPILYTWIRKYAFSGNNFGDKIVHNFWTNIDVALRIIKSRVIKKGGGHWTWLRRLQFDVTERHRRYEKRSDNSPYVQELADLAHVIGDRNVRFAAATATIDPNEVCAMELLYELKDKLQSTARSFWHTLFLAGRHLILRTRAHCYPSQREQCLVEIANALASEVQQIAEANPAESVRTLAQEIIEKLYEPGGALANADARAYEGDFPPPPGRIQRLMNAFRGAPDDEPNAKRSRTGHAFGGSAIAFVLAQSDDAKSFPPADPTATRLPTGPSVVDAVFEARVARMRIFK